MVECKSEPSKDLNVWPRADDLASIEGWNLDGVAVRHYDWDKQVRLPVDLLLFF